MQPGLVTPAEDARRLIEVHVGLSVLPGIQANRGPMHTCGGVLAGLADRLFLLGQAKVPLVRMFLGSARVLAFIASPRHPQSSRTPAHAAPDEFAVPRVSIPRPDRISPVRPTRPRGGRET